MFFSHYISFCVGNTESGITIVQPTGDTSAVLDTTVQNAYGTAATDDDGEWHTVEKKKKSKITVTGITKKFASKTKQHNDRTTLYNYPILTN